MATPTICAFPLSSQYAAPIRVLTYPLILMSPAGYLPSGTLLTLYTYCSVSSLHLLAMAAVPTHTPRHAPQSLDLDIFPAYYLVVLALLVTPCSLSRALSATPPKPFSLFVLIAFALLAWTGTVSMIIATAPSRRPLLSECVAKNGVAGCISECQHYTLPMRSGQKPRAVAYPSIFYAHQVPITRTGISVLTAWLLLAFIPSRSPNVSPMLETGSTPAPTRPRRGSLRAATTILLVATWIFTGEIFLGTLPTAEKADAVGQWGPVVAFILVALAVGIRRGDARVPAATEAQVAVGSAAGGDCAVGGGNGAYEGLGGIDHGKGAPTSEERDLGMPTAAYSYLDIAGAEGEAPEVRWD